MNTPLRYGSALIAGLILICLVCLPSHASDPSCVPAPTGLVSWWPGDGDAGDIVGGNNGVPVNGAIFVAGGAGKCKSTPAPTVSWELLVSSANDNRVLRFNGTSGAFIDTFVPAGSGGLNFPDGLAVGPDGNLLVAGDVSQAVHRYNGSTGAFIDEFVPAGSAGLHSPGGNIFGPDGNLYVTSDDGGSADNRIKRYNGLTGTFIDDFVPMNSGGLFDPGGVVFGPDGNLYVSNLHVNSIKRYDGTTGAYLGDFVSSGSGGLCNPLSLVFGPDGNLYVAGTCNNAVLRYNNANGSFMGVFASSPGLVNPQGLAFGPDGNLYVSSFDNNSVLRFDGTTGAFIDTFVSSVGGGLSGAGVLLFRAGPVPTPSPSPSSCLPPPGGLVSWWPGDGNAFDIKAVMTGLCTGAPHLRRAKSARRSASTGGAIATSLPRMRTALPEAPKRPTTRGYTLLPCRPLGITAGSSGRAIRRCLSGRPSNADCYIRGRTQETLSSIWIVGRTTPAPSFIGTRPIRTPRTTGISSPQS